MLMGMSFGLALTLLSLSLLLPKHPDTVTFAGWLHNMVPVTLGNMVGGAVFVGMAFGSFRPCARKYRCKLSPNLNG